MSIKIDYFADPAVQKFIGEHSSALDSSMQKVEMSETMHRRLTRSNYIFSGMKTFHELNEAFPSLLDENGNRKSFERFLNDVQKIDRTYNVNYLRAEYNFVNASAQMAAKWEQFMEDGDRYYLQYRTQRDDKVRPEHAALDRVTLPITDSFWEEFYPPNGWNCRCNVVQVLKSKYPTTPHDEAMRLGDEALQRDTKGMFRFNPGKEEKSIPDYNPYTIRKCNTCPIAKGNKPGNLAKLAPPDNTVCAACHEIHDIANRFETNRRLYERLRNSPNYHDVEFDPSTGGLKATHINHNFDSKKGWYESIAQEAGFKKGYSVIFTQERHDRYKKKNVEGRWNGFKFEVTAAETAIPNNIRNALKHCASKDAQIAVIVFPMKEMDYDVFNEGLSKYIGLKGTPQYHHFKFIYCVDKSGNIIYTKKPSD